VLALVEACPEVVELLELAEEVLRLGSKPAEPENKQVL
jgi:hypothetical protein